MTAPHVGRFHCSSKRPSISYVVVSSSLLLLSLFFEGGVDAAKEGGKGGAVTPCEKREKVLTGINQISVVGEVRSDDDGCLGCASSWTDSSSLKFQKLSFGSNAIIARRYRISLRFPRRVSLQCVHVALMCLQRHSGTNFMHRLLQTNLPTLDVSPFFCANKHQHQYPDSPDCPDLAKTIVVVMVR